MKSLVNEMVLDAHSELDIDLDIAKCVFLSPKHYQTAQEHLQKVYYNENVIAKKKKNNNFKKHFCERFCNFF